MQPDMMEHNSEGGPQQRPRSAQPTRSQPVSMYYKTASNSRPHSALVRPATPDAATVGAEPQGQAAPQATMEQQAPHEGQPTQESLVQNFRQIRDTFLHIDESCGGDLPTSELKRVIADHSADMNLAPEVVECVQQHLERNHDDTVDYEGFMEFCGRAIAGDEDDGWVGNDSKENEPAYVDNNVRMGTPGSVSSGRKGSPPPQRSGSGDSAAAMRQRPSSARPLSSGRSIASQDGGSRPTSATVRSAGGANARSRSRPQSAASRTFESTFGGGRTSGSSTQWRSASQMSTEQRTSLANSQKSRWTDCI